jgi:hypothetical protein
VVILAIAFNVTDIAVAALIGVCVLISLGILNACSARDRFGPSPGICSSSVIARGNAPRRR